MTIVINMLLKIEDKGQMELQAMWMATARWM